MEALVSNPSIHLPKDRAMPVAKYAATSMKNAKANKLSIFIRDRFKSSAIFDPLESCWWARVSTKFNIVMTAIM